MAKNINQDLEFIQDIIFATGFTKTKGPHYLEKMIEESEKLKSRTINAKLKDFPSPTQIHFIIRYWTLEQGISSFEDDLHTLNTRSPLVVKQERNIITPTIEPTSPLSYMANTSVLASNQQHNSFSFASSPKRVCNNNFPILYKYKILINVLIIL